MPFFAPPTQTLFTHFGQGDVEFPVRYVREPSGRLTIELPVVGSAVPVTSEAIGLRTHVESAPFGSGNGGPKKHRASGAQLPGAAGSQFRSLVHAMPVWTSLMQCFPAPYPRVQFPGPVPALADRVVPVSWSMDVAESGILSGATVVAAPPPM